VERACHNRLSKVTWRALSFLLLVVKLNECPLNILIVKSRSAAADPVLLTKKTCYELHEHIHLSDVITSMGSVSRVLQRCSRIVGRRMKSRTTCWGDVSLFRGGPVLLCGVTVCDDVCDYPVSTCIPTSRYLTGDSTTEFKSLGNNGGSWSRRAS